MRFLDSMRSYFFEVSCSLMVLFALKSYCSLQTADDIAEGFEKQGTVHDKIA